MAIWRHIACCISKATRSEAHASAHTHARTHTYELIYARPPHTHTQKYVRLQWFCERASMSRHTHTTCLVIEDTDCVYCAVGTEAFE
jgi:hypothetical protein